MDVNNWKSYENGVQEKTNSSSSESQIGLSSTVGPDPAKLKAIIDRTNYSHHVTVGQRKYGGPPPDWTQSPPPAGSEIFVGRIPKDVYEDELIVLFEKIGKLWDLRLMIDPLTSQSRGYGFITYCNKEDALKAVQEFNGYKIRSKNFSLKVNISVPNVRLFIGNIPKIMSKEQIFIEFNKLIEGLTEVITYSSPDDRKKNRGFCFLEFDSHKNASAAKRKLTSNGMKIFKCDILVDWADPQEEPDEETMSKVKVLYVRNLTSEVTESQLKELFEDYGTIERVKKIKDYAFVHFEDREQALNAMEKANGKDFGGSNIEISLAKPPSDRRKKEEVLRNREKRMFTMMQQRQYNMMTFPRVPSSQIRPPIQSIPPLPSTNMLPMRSGRNRFSQPVNPMMAPVAFNRQNQTWNPLLFYDPSEWWYHSGNRGGGTQFNFPNIPPPGAQWNYGIANGPMPSMPQFGLGNGPNRRNGPGNNVVNGNALNNNGNASNNHRKWRKTNVNQNGSNVSGGGNKK
ncbi:hypothetical protein BLOT_001545 [Blomia tropicalis]|nr:hypothetical protein BLOT_001545 [Blomia tropicalis]